jgi:hypothetical protein
MRLQRRRGIQCSTIVIVLGALVVGGYLAAPLFYDRGVDEPFPTAAATQPAPAAAATASMQAAASATDAPAEDDMPADEMASASLLASGTFYSIEHEGEGTAAVYRLADGSLVLRFEDFYVLNGPDLHVYLTSADPVPGRIGVDLPDWLDLGPLKGNIGDQNYDLPPDFDLSRYRSVVIWCVPFKVPFSGAALAAP